MVSTIGAIIVFTTFVLFLLYVIINGELSKFKLYRQYKGGIWYKSYLKEYPYMKSWTQDKDSIYPHETIEKIENYEV